MIELRQVSKSYEINQKPFHALKNINLQINRGEIFGILGKSGAGKSTLLRCINLLERPSSGQVIVNDVDITALPTTALRHLRQRIGIVFQQFNLLESRNAFDNIALPLEIIKSPRNIIDSKVNELLDLVGLKDKKQHFPTQLSGGQKQRVAIARALAADPYVLLCDEATSALDTESTKSILRLLKQINRTLNITILLITHELEVIKTTCDRVGVIHDGELIEQDTAINVIVNPQSPITQQLVQQTTAFLLPHSTEETCILRLTFIGTDSDLPLISSLAKRFAITVNIRQALIETIQETTVGFTICELSGNKSSLDEALVYLHDSSIKVEILNHG